jgi:hypothetical protein
MLIGYFLKYFLDKFILCPTSDNRLFFVKIIKIGTPLRASVPPTPKREGYNRLQYTSNMSVVFSDVFMLGRDNI